MTSPLFLCAFLPLAVAGLIPAQKFHLGKAWLLLCSCAFFALIADGWGILLPVLLLLLALGMKKCGRTGRILYILAAILSMTAVKSGIDAPCVSYAALGGIMYVCSAPDDLPVQDGALYLAFFPKLLAGPVAEYRQFTVSAQSARDINEGLSRFVWGLSKKLLIADRLLSLAQSQTGPLLLVICPLAVYYDFSGYTDMALGAARALGVTLPENFDRPFSACSVREFWRRWHMTLSGFLKKYVYIPLGGSRTGHTTRNLLIVFLLMGLWHGFTLPYLLFGCLHGVLAALEHKNAFHLEKLPMLVRRVYTLFAVAVSFALFLSPDIGSFARVFSGVSLRCTPVDLALLGIAVLLPAIQGKLQIPRLVREAGVAVLLILCLMAAFAHGYSPFLYAQF